MRNLHRLDIYENPIENIEKIDLKLFKGWGLEFLEKLNLV